MQTVLNLMLKIMASAKTNVPKPMLSKAFDGQYRQLCKISRMRVFS